MRLMYKNIVKQVVTFCVRGWAVWRHGVMLACLVVGFGVVGPVNAQQQRDDPSEQPLRFGILPHLSTHLLLKKYKPLIDYLKADLNRPIVLNTAPSFKEYIKRAAEGRFDIYLTAPHMAYYHKDVHRHYPLAVFSTPLKGVIAVAKDAPFQTLADLRGKTFAMPDALGVIPMQGELTLMDAGFDMEKDVSFKFISSHNNAIHAVADGRADAAIAGLPAYKITEANGQLRQPLRILATTEEIPHLMFMSPSRIAVSEAEKFKATLLRFTDEGPGRYFYRKVPFGELRAVSEGDFIRLEILKMRLEERL